MPDLTVPLTSAVVFVGVGWLIVHAGEQHADAIRHTLSVFVLAFGLLALIGVIAELRASMGVDRMSHRIEARSQADAASPARTVRRLDAGLNP
ncbi:hypothetical protein [Methylobacterium sp. CM6246]